MKKLELKNVSSLEKIMPQMTCAVARQDSGSVLLDEVFSYQIAFKLKESDAKELDIEICSDLNQYIRIYTVRYVPVMNNRRWMYCDENVISDSPGVFPDVLEPAEGVVSASSHYYNAIWIDVKPEKGTTAGVHNIKISFKDRDTDEVWGESNFDLEVIGKSLPALDIPFTQWFHCDCISSYYDCEPLTERHWELIERYMKTAVEHGVNMILTPIFTPALDTKIGAERPTVQLVDVSYESGVYTFGFEKLQRWLELCRKVGVKYLEMAHLYSQWGAKATPKVEVKENGRMVKKFGWHTEALSEEYKDFIAQLLPQLTAFLERNWVKENIFFHISDEPNALHIEHYGEIYRFISPLLSGFNQIDAISDYEIYEKGYIDIPVSSTTAISNFIDRGVENLWAYYCCDQSKNNLSNRMIAMTSHRNRILGVQAYKYNIKGLLQWGYNFWYNKHSTRLINPYLVNDTDGALPSGDAFSVYPGRNGALPSLRLKVFRNALQDIMALKLLENKIGREKVMELLSEVEGFTDYPDDSSYIPELREKINALLR